MNFARLIAPASAFLLLAGCGGLQLNMVDSAHRRPSNVAVYFSLDDADGAPIGGLTAEDFEILEDGRLVSEAESQQTIINPEVAAEHYTLLLIDMSGSVTESDQVPMIEEAAREFTSQLESHQKVALYAFDGSEEIHRITPFTGASGAANAGVGRLSSFRTRDPSTNLHGAVLSAIEELDDAMARSRVPLRFGTVVIFTDGTDRAARITAEAMGESIDGSAYDFFAIGVGDEIDENVLAGIGREGYVMVSDRSAISSAFQEISARITTMTQRYYLLSYCSPARAGVHQVTVQATHEGESGALTYEFDAEGFRPDCDPSRPPPFQVRNPGATPRTRGRSSRGRRLEVRARPPAAAVEMDFTSDPEGGAE